MKRWEKRGLFLLLGGTFLLAGCSFQFQAKRGEKSVGKIIEAPKPEPEVVKVPEVEKELVTTHTVVKGETLWDIAGYKEIYGDSTKWKLIYEANRDILNSPDSLKPGQMLIIPRE